MLICEKLAIYMQKLILKLQLKIGSNGKEKDNLNMFAKGRGYCAMSSVHTMPGSYPRPILQVTSKTSSGCRAKLSSLSLSALNSRTEMINIKQIILK